MSAIRNPEPRDRWLRIVATIALVYAIGLIVFGIRLHQSPAQWVGRIGSIAVIAGVLLHHQRTGVSLPRSGSRVMNREAIARMGTTLIAAGITAIVIGFAMGIVGY